MDYNEKFQHPHCNIPIIYRPTIIQWENSPKKTQSKGVRFLFDNTLLQAAFMTNFPTG